MTLPTASVVIANVKNIMHVSALISSDSWRVLRARLGHRSPGSGLAALPASGLYAFANDCIIATPRLAR